MRMLPQAKMRDKLGIAISKPTSPSKQDQGQLDSSLLRRKYLCPLLSLLTLLPPVKFQFFSPANMQHFST
jgi:hypothetical protein